MSVTEGQVQVAPDSTGKNVANVVITRADGTVVYRQEIVLADAEVNGFRAAITKYGELQVNTDPMLQTRHSLEVQEFQQLDQLRATLRTRQTERFNLTDRRGSVGRGSTR